MKVPYQIRLDAETISDLKEKAKAHDISVNRLIRIAITDLLKNEEDKKIY